MENSTQTAGDVGDIVQMRARAKTQFRLDEIETKSWVSNSDAKSNRSPDSRKATGSPHSTYVASEGASEWDAETHTQDVDEYVPYGEDANHFETESVERDLHVGWALCGYVFFLTFSSITFLSIHILVPVAVDFWIESKQKNELDFKSKACELFLTPMFEPMFLSFFVILFYYISSRWAVECLRFKMTKQTKLRIGMYFTSTLFSLGLFCALASYLPPHVNYITSYIDTVSQMALKSERGGIYERLAIIPQKLAVNCARIVQSNVTESPSAGV